MSEDKSKLQLIGEIAQANNKNLELIEELNDKEEEIERLIISLQAQEELTMNEHIKVERLNNIINELEKWFKDMNLEKLATFDDYDIGQYNAYKKVIDKLQELKGSDKAIPPEVIGTNGEDGGLFDYGDR